MTFTHIHVHTQFSVLESTIKIPDLVQHVKNLGMESVAITDTQSASGIIQFSQACAKVDIKPIIGTQLNILSHGSIALSNEHPESPIHSSSKGFLSRINVLAATPTGFKNLSRLLTLSYAQKKNATPAIDKDLLAKHKDGLICIMPMDCGEWIEYFRRNRLDDFESSFLFFINTFKDDFYAEIYRPVEYALLTTYEHHLLELQEKNPLKLVASNAAYYLKPEDYFPCHVLNCIRQSVKIENPKEEAHRTGMRDVCAPEAMAERFSDLPEAIAATGEIKRKVSFDFEFNRPGYKKTYHLPQPTIPKNETVESYFQKECLVGLKNRLAHKHLSETDESAYWARLDNEISVITEMNFCGYFLIVMDFIRFARSQNIPVGPGRGSGAGSLAAYALQITDLDPIQHDLLFERFLNPERISLPDFDVDFCMDRRPEVIQYVVNKYGADRVAQIITFGKLQARMVIRDVGRVFGFTPKEVDRLSKLIPDVLGITLDEAIKKEPTLENLINTTDNIALLFNTAIKLEGLVRHSSIHAAGLVIANDALDMYCPLCVGRDNVVTTQLDMVDLEKVGLVKFDFLGLKTLTMLNIAERDIVSREKTEFKISDIPLDDPQVFHLLKSGNTVGVFQLESPGMQTLCTKLKPDSFADITAINALYRPGPLGSGMVDDFIQRKHGLKNISYELPQLKSVLEETYGVIVYQEQVQKIAVELAGYSLGAADILRRAMGKKKPEEMAKQRDRFLDGTRNNNIAEDKATRIFDLMAMFAEYGFNKSHAAAYALISYQTAFLKTHFPAQFYASLLTIEFNFSDKVKRYIDDAKNQGIRVLPPDINDSGQWFSVVDPKTIRFGLLGIKGVGTSAIENIMVERKSKPFSCLSDFCARVELQKVNRRVIEALIKSGAFDFTEIPRARLVEMIDTVLGHAHYVKDKGFLNQSSLFESETSADQEDKALAQSLNTDWDILTIATHEREHLGCYLTVHPFDQYEHIRKKLKIKSAADCLKMFPDQSVILFGIISKIKVTTNRAKEARTLLTCEDRHSIFDVTCFFENAKTQTGSSKLEVGQVYVFHATIESTFHKKLRVRVRQPDHVQKLDEHLAEGQRFNVHFSLEHPADQPHDAVFKRFRTLLDRHRGLSPCFLRLNSPPLGTIYLQLPEHGVSITPGLIEDTKSLLGSDGIHIQYAREVQT